MEWESPVGNITEVSEEWPMMAEAAGWKWEDERAMCNLRTAPHNILTNYQQKR